MHLFLFESNETHITSSFQSLSNAHPWPDTSSASPIRFPQTSHQALVQLIEQHLGMFVQIHVNFILRGVHFEQMS